VTKIFETLEELNTALVSLLHAFQAGKSWSGSDGRTTHPSQWQVRSSLICAALATRVCAALPLQLQLPFFFVQRSPRLAPLAPLVHALAHLGFICFIKEEGENFFSKHLLPHAQKFRIKAFRVYQ
jgi:hypothetical protein